jgi:hypothetical protein
MQNYVYGERKEGSPMLAQKLLSGDMARVLREAGEIARGLYAATVAKQSGALAASARVGAPVIGGEKSDRLTITVTAGAGTPRGGYGASHEFGIGIHPRSRVPPTAWMPQKAVDDWVKVLAIMDALP